MTTRIECQNTIHGKALHKLCSSLNRKAVNHSPVDKAIARHARKTFRTQAGKVLAAFAATVRRETAQARADIYEVQAMIASGLVRFPRMMPQGVVQAYVGKRNSWRPALPSNQKMPPDKQTAYSLAPLAEVATLKH